MVRPSNLIVGPELLKLKMRLLPLQQVEESLLQKMTPAGSSELEPTHLSAVKKKAGKSRELAINSTTQWKSAFGRLIATARASFESSTLAEIDIEAPNDAGVILHACSEDIIKLWNDPTVKALLEAQNIRLQDKSGLCVIQTSVALIALTEISFLDSIERVTALRYVPTDGESAIVLAELFT
jgi:guanine nucleotide-binding protein alpha-1 subunit